MAIGCFFGPPSCGVTAGHPPPRINHVCLRPGSKLGAASLPIYTQECVLCPGYNITFARTFENTMPNAFVIQSRYVLLTYAQCGDLDPFRIVDVIASVGGECIIGRELHDNGGIHLHAFCDFGRKFRSRVTAIFDVDGRHPNISASRGNPGEGYDYAIKDGDICAGGLERPTNDEAGQSGGADWSGLVSIDDEDEFWDTVKADHPRVLLVNFPSLKQYAAWRFVVREEEYRSPPNIDFALESIPELADWSGANLDRPLVGE